MRFVSNATGYLESIFIVRISGQSKNEREILEEFSTQLLFPDYFGFNWDALFDFLMALSWIEEKGIIVIHNELPQLPKDELRIYLEILRDTITHWEQFDEHTFEVVFPMESEVVVKQLLK